MKLLCTLLLLLVPCLSHAQDSLSLAKLPTQEQLKSANEILEASKKKATIMPAGGYAFVDIKMEGKLTSYIVPGSDDCIKSIFLPKNTAYEGWLVNKGESAFRWTKVEPVAFDRMLVTGIKQGTATMIWMMVVNGEAQVVAAFQFQIGNPPPKPPDPIDPPPVDPVDPSDTLVAAALSDIKAGKGTANDVQAYAMIYLLYSTQVKNDKNLKTVGDLYKEMNLKIDTLLGDDIEKTMTSLRKAVGVELRGKIPTNAGQALDDATRTTISNALGSIYKRLSTGVR
jgi:hypothetical protein